MPHDITATPEATLTIKQMAAQSGMSEYTLRYYEKIGLIQPIPRDGSSGHRRYSAATAQMVEALACLRASGLSLDEMNHFNTILSTHTAPPQLPSPPAHFSYAAQQAPTPVRPASQQD